ncbi:MAG: hypothetical protein M0C28_12810 [Candidatus Moduliflexus flocculans]|nr:hypothetical protein [Candidatus Moduliflexus flocculans]
MKEACHARQYPDRRTGDPARGVRRLRSRGRSGRGGTGHDQRSSRRGPGLDGQARRLSSGPGPPQLDRRRRLGLPAPDQSGDRDDRDRRGPLRRPGEGAQGRGRGQAHSPEDLARPGAGIRHRGPGPRRGRGPAAPGRSAQGPGRRGPSSTKSSSPGSTRPARPSRSSWSRRPWPCPTRRSSWSSTAAIGPRRTRPRCARS